MFVQRLHPLPQLIKLKLSVRLMTRRFKMIFLSPTATNGLPIFHKAELGKKQSVRCLCLAPQHAHVHPDNKRRLKNPKMDQLSILSNLTNIDPIVADRMYLYKRRDETGITIHMMAQLLVQPGWRCES